MRLLAVGLFLLLRQELFISGVVTGLNGDPLAGAELILEHVVDRRLWQVRTLADGTFRVDQLPQGSYRVTVVKEGFFTADVDLQMEASKNLEVALAPNERRTEKIEVTARPAPIDTEAVAAPQNVDNRQFQNLQYTGRRNFLNAVALTPGVLRDNTGRLHVHGAASDQLRYQMDGLDLTDPSGGGLAANVPLDAIENVDVDFTPYSPETGKGSGGVIRIQSQFLGDKFRWDLTDFIPNVNFSERAIGEFSPRLLLSGPLVRKRLWAMAAGAFRYVQNFNEDLPRGSNRQNETVIDQLAKLQWNVREAHVLTLSFLGNSEYFGNAGLNRQRPVEATTNFLKRGMTLAVTDRSLVGRTLFETLGQWTHRRESDLARGTRTLEVYPSNWIGNYFADRGAESDRVHIAEHIAWEKRSRGITHRLRTGGEFDYVNQQLHLERRNFEVFRSARDLRMKVAFSGATRAEIGNREYGLFLQDRLVLSSRLQVETGVRFDRERVSGQNRLSPRIAFAFLPSGNERSKLSGGAGIFVDAIPLHNFLAPLLQTRTNTLYERGQPAGPVTRVATLAAHEVRSPYAFHWNLTWDQEWATRWVTRLGYIDRAGHRQVRLSGIPGAGRLDLVVNNSGSARYRAMEISLERPIRTDLRLLASYTYSTSRGRPSLNHEFPDPDLEGLPRTPTDWDAPHRLISWGYFPVWFSAFASYVVEARSGFPYTIVDDLGRNVEGHNTRRFPAFVVVNLNVEREIPFFFGSRVALRLGANNLLNRFNPRFVDANIHSPTFLRFSDSSGRSLVGRLRLVRK